MNAFPHGFTGRIETHHLGTLAYTVVFLPPEVAAALPFDGRPRLRMSGEIDGASVAGAWQPVRGRWYLMLNRTTLRRIGKAVGDEVSLAFRIEADDAVEVPDALAAELARNPAAADTWAIMTPGQRRGALHWLTSARTVATYRRRLGETIERLEMGDWPGATAASRKARRRAPLKSGGG